MSEHVAAGPLRYQLLDVFTDTPLAGNQLAVFGHTPRPLASERMQQIARELNLSETVFLEPPTTRDDGTGGDAKARIFTPLQELPFAGHPVLGTAIVVGRGGRDEVRLETGAGIVPVALDWSGPAPFGRMTQPAPRWSACGFAEGAMAALGSPTLRLAPEIYANGPEFVMVVFASRDELAALTPDVGALLALGNYGFYCAAPAGSAWEVRMFSPAFGISEDPATGSGAGLFVTHLVRHGLTGFGAEIEIVQGLRIGRPSKLYASAHGSAERIERVEVGGCAVFAGEGRLRDQLWLDP